MTVHVGRISSEVTDTAPAQTAPAQTAGEQSPWAEQAALEAGIERLAEIRLRTATGHGDD